jgi:hypothetical protein
MPISIDALQPGSALIYFEGTSLARERGAAINAAADLVWQAALRGEVDLMQRRVGNKIQYLVVKRRMTDPSPVQPVLPSQGVRRAA